MDDDSTATPPRIGIDDRLRAARDRFVRVDAREAARRATQGAVIVDIRPDRQRTTFGEIPGALLIDRNVLEWRLDPSSVAALPIASYDLEVIVVCQEGYASSLAAEMLVELGVHRATDLEGGFEAWQEAGLPWQRPGDAAQG